MSVTEKNVCCMVCDYKTGKVFNLNRHMVLKHDENKTILFNKKAILFNKKAILFNKKAIHDENKTILFNKKAIDKLCNICDKIFSSKQYLNTHITKCKGKIDPLVCQYCDLTFKFSTNKSKHLKVCKVKKEQECRELIVQDEQQPQLISQTNNITNNNTTNNNQTAETINNNKNVMIFNINSDFIKGQEMIKKIMEHINNGNVLDHVSTFKNCSREIFSEPENRCIRKKNIKLPHSQVHLGEDKWEHKLDEDIYPPLVCKFADELGNIDMTGASKNLVTKRRKFDKFLDYISDGGYINGTPEDLKDMKKQFKSLVNDLSLIIFNRTKV